MLETDPLCTNLFLETMSGNYVWNLGVNIAVALGGAIGEIVDANEPVLAAAKRGADEGTSAFFESWMALAERLTSQARANEAEGHDLTASAKHHRACVYYMAAERMQKFGYAPREQAYAKMLDAMRDAARLGRRNVEFVEIPYEGQSYPGLFVKADGEGGKPAPCVIHTNGLDSVKEMIYWSGIGDRLAARGVSMLAIDHPGTGEALRLRGMPGRYDAEVWASAAVDYLESRDDVDPDGIGIMGWSLGGYYAPRAAAFERRLKLVVSWGANHFWGDLQKRRLQREGENPVPHYWEHVMWVFGQPNMDAFMAWAPKMTLDGVVERITVPYLITHGEKDRQIPVEAAHRSYEQAVNSSRRDIHIFTDEDGGVEHSNSDNIGPAADFTADWVSDRFRELQL